MAPGTISDFQTGGHLGVRLGWCSAQASAGLRIFGSREVARESAELRVHRRLHPRHALREGGWNGHRRRYLRGSESS